ncbi:MAG: peptidylprolyl isomerase, partial [Pseudomonadota bacterium]
MQHKKTYFHPAIALLIALAIGWGPYNVLAAEQKEPAQKKEKAAAAPQKAEKKGGQSKEVIVDVNGSKLTRGEVDTEINNQLEAIKKQVPPDQMDKLQGQLGQMKDKIEEQKINQFIERIILTQEADKLKIAVTDNETNAVIKNYEKQIPPGMTLESILKMQGMTIEKMKDEIKFSLRANKLVESQVKADKAPSEEEIKQYYESNKEKFDEPESVHARHILLKAGPSDNETVKAVRKTKIDGIRKQLTSGADFEKVAKESSECPSKAKGGDLGTFSRGRMIKPFEDAAFGQKLNEVGPVVETQFGSHIIQ